VPNDLTFLAGLRRRVQLPEADRGPRALAIAGRAVYAANYFSDTLSAVALEGTNSVAKSFPLSPRREMDAVRRGEFYFHDASICLQGWQSCSTCHPGDARMDGLDWDLLNDGRNNPKNTKSLLFAHRTPPAMSLGVRDSAEDAVRAGIQHILFTRQPPSVAADMDAYLKSLRPVPSPHLERGRLSAAARRGQRVFDRAGCADCHPPPLFTNLKPYDVGSRVRGDQPDDEFYTPTLLELWRTAPYLHDGSAATVRDVLTSHNPRDRHGRTSSLTGQELDDLCAYLLSL
jgi:cytochrome c peroxidase